MGSLQLLTYGRVVRTNLRTVEQLNLFHFYPGMEVLTVEMTGDNFRCPTDNKKEVNTAKDVEKRGEEYTTEQERIERITIKETAENIIAQATDHHANAIAFVGREPLTSIEFVVEAAVKAKEAGLYVILTTNGYVGKEALADIAPYIDAVQQTFYAFTEEDMQMRCRALLEPVQRTAVFCKKKRDIHLEVSLYLSESGGIENPMFEEFLLWSKESLSEKTPIHFITKEDNDDLILIEALNMADELRLQYVYSEKNQNTYVDDKYEAIKRTSNILLENNLTKGKYKNKKIPGKFES